MTDTTTIIEPHLTVDGEPRWYGNSLFEFLVPAAATGGALSVFRATMPEGFGPPRHIHTREDEVFLVLEGEALFDIDGRILRAGPGATVFMPRGVPHTFRVQSPVAVMLGVMTPGGFEETVPQPRRPRRRAHAAVARRGPVRRAGRDGRAGAARHAGRRPADERPGGVTRA